MDVVHDAFRITYDPDQVTLDEMFERIRGLGYRPSRLADDVRLDVSAPKASRGPLPGMIADLLADSVDTRPLFLDFHATWCAPCRALERNVFPKEQVRKALARFKVLKIDTDEHPGVAQYFNIVGLPTLMVLGVSGEERFRHMGLIQADTLTARLRHAAGATRRK